MKKIGIIANNDPRNPKTWSGTPNNLIQSFEKNECKCLCISLPSYVENGLLRKILKKISLVSANFSVLGTNRTLKNIRDYFFSAECDNIIHMPGNLIMPHSMCKNGLKHYGFLDSTFNQLWIPWINHTYKNLKFPLRCLLSIEIRRRNLFYGRAVRNFNHIFVTSKWVKESLTNDYRVEPDKISVVYTGTGKVRDLGIEYENRPKRFLFVAKHNYIDKGAKILLEAFRLVRETNPCAELVMVGPNPEAIGALPNESRVTFHGYLEWAELELLFNESYAYVMPSLYEPYGLVYLEAMQCSAPIICAASGGMSSIVEEYDCGWILNDRSALKLADILRSCLNHPTESKNKGMRGKSFVMNYCTWNKCATEIIKQIEKDSE
jgi:glycosyltransferase involved in cell wall biosynthesis